MEEMLSSAEREPAERTHGPAWKLRFPRRLLRAIAPFWVVCLVAGSFLPGTMKERLGTTAQSESVHALREVALTHRIVHIASFGSTALLFLVIATTVRNERRGAAFVLLLGCTIETLQYLQSGAVLFEWWDVLDDFYGIAAVFIVVQMLNRLHEELAQNGHEVKRAARRPSEFLSCMAARIRALCASKK